ncbi:mRNA-decapping enzyme-like protein [Vitis vinifera]|uniref:mRNA-decapping enzyme-like protein n=1 Tax=Vitis vinifera TaxID=29760 RepID=A0A438EKB6_VITVI|nr:mRNA-decapping enzyme-like protein [Vitis vinifera]
MDFLWGGGALVQKLHLVRWNMEAWVSDVWNLDGDGGGWTLLFSRVFNDWEPGDSPLFPSGSIWRASVPLKVAFFAWEASWEKVLTLDQFQRRGHFLTNRSWVRVSMDLSPSSLVSFIDWLGSNEFEELEAVPTMAVMEGMLEPSSTASATTDAPEDSTFVNFFGAAMNIGSNTSNVANSGQSYQPSITVPSFSHAPSVVPSPVPTLQVPSLPRSASSTPPLPIHETPDPISSSNLATNLVKPSSFFAPPSSSSALIMPPMPSSMPTAGLILP